MFLLSRQESKQMRHATSSNDEEFFLLLIFFEVFHPLLLIGCLAEGLRFRFTFSICCRSKAFFSGVFIKMGHFRFLLFTLVFFCGGTFGSGLKIYQDSLVYSHKETLQVSTVFGWK